MKLIIDDADLNQIKSIYEYYPVDGVTTNPLFWRKQAGPLTRCWKKSARILEAKLSFMYRWWPGTSFGMAEDAYRIVERLGRGTFVKIPAIPKDSRR